MTQKKEIYKCEICGNIVEMFKTKILYPHSWVYYSRINDSQDVLFIHHIKYKNSWYNVVRTKHAIFYSKRWKKQMVLSTIWRTCRAP